MDVLHICPHPKPKIASYNLHRGPLGRVFHSNSIRVESVITSKDYVWPNPSSDET